MLACKLVITTQNKRYFLDDRSGVAALNARLTKLEVRGGDDSKTLGLPNLSIALLYAQTTSGKLAPAGAPRPCLLSRFDIILEKAAVAKLVEYNFQLVALNVFYPAVAKAFMINPGADGNGGRGVLGRLFGLIHTSP